MKRFSILSVLALLAVSAVSAQDEADVVRYFMFIGEPNAAA